MKNVLLLVHDDNGQEARLQAALDLTRALGGHLRCVDVTIAPALIMDDMDGIGGAMLLEEERRREGANKTALQTRLKFEDVSWDWIDTTASLTEGVLEAAMLADIIVLNSGFDSYPSTRDVVSQILMRCHRPVLTVPETLSQASFGRALIAWDGQASCAATLRACTDLLALADEVEIFMVRDKDGHLEPDAAAEYLSRHDIHANIRVIEDDVHAPDALIEQECVRWRADYVLMGAYNHGRIAEIFGGVTKRMLGRVQLPVILGH